MRPYPSLALLTACFAFPTAAAAQTDDAPELWLNPTAEWALDDDTAVELDTGQRFRRKSDGRADTSYGRLWLHQELSDALTLSGGIERQTNRPGDDETRLLQQLSVSRSVLRSRLRLEQRFVEEGRVGVRFRPRLGVELPVGSGERWSAQANAELFLTLRSPSPGGEEGLTGMRTQIGAGYRINERLSVSLVYLRQQDIREDAPDVVGHAPLLGLELSF